MRRALLASTLLSLALPSVAFAQYDDLEAAEEKSTYQDDTTTSSDGGYRFGLGIRALMSGLFDSALASPAPGGGAAFLFDAGQFRIEAALGLLFVEDASTTFGFAGRFLWIVHKGSRADLGVGAGIGFSHTERDAPNADVTLFHGEGLVQVYIWLASNAAFTGALGLGLAAGDGATFLRIGGMLNGSLGFSYFFD